MKNTTYQTRLAFTVVFLSVAFGGVIYAFYSQDVKNSLPTEVPARYTPTLYGQSFAIKSEKKLKLIHFFNPDCPCSKFNTKHVENLLRQYGDNVEFIAYSTSHVPEDYPIKVLEDTDGKMASLLGVYSTPQAVLLDSDGKLLYRGNYNKSRFCSNKDTEYAAIAIEHALKHKNTAPLFSQAGKPYGCKIEF